MTEGFDSRTARWGKWLGMWGAVSGIAMFLTWDTVWRHHGAGMVAFELTLAAAAAFVAERSKERVEGHGAGHLSIVGSIVILVVLEFFVLGWHGVPGMQSAQLADISRRILGEASSARPASVYAFEIRFPQQLRLRLALADKVLSNTNQHEAEELRAQWMRSLTPPVTLEEEEERELVAYRILQLQTPEDRRLILNDQTTDADLDRALEKALNTAIGSGDFQRFVNSRHQTAHGGGETHALPPASEMERRSRREIEQAFPHMISPLPEPDRREWVDLGLAVIPILIVGFFMGLAIVFIVEDRRRRMRPNDMGAATVRGLWLGALLAGLGALAGFFVYTFVLRFVMEIVAAPAFSAAAAFDRAVAGIGNSIGAASQAAMLFVLPGAALGAIVPWLRPPSRSPRFWSVIALAAAGLALAVSLYSGHRYWWIPAGSLLALFIVWSIRAGHSIQWYWTAAAFVVALFVCAVTVAAQVTLGSVLTDLHLFIQKPVNPYTRWVAGKAETTAELAERWSGQAAEGARRAEYLRNPKLKEAYDAETEARTQEAIHVGRALEISVVGGLGFWITIAALVAWRVHDDTQHR